MKLLKLFTIALILVVAGCTETLLDTESLTDDALKSGHKKPLTFESEFDIWLSGERTRHFLVDDEGNLVLDENDQPILVSFDQTIEGIGNARHLGKTKVIIEETITILDVSVNPPTIVYPMQGLAQITFIAANGDELHFETESNMTFEGHNPDNPIINIVSTGSTFKKGTGRFKKAKDGELHKVGMFNNDPEVYAGTATYTVRVEF